MMTTSSFFNKRLSFSHVHPHISKIIFLYVMCIQEHLRVGLRRLSALPCMGQYKFLFYFFAHNSSHFLRLTGIYGEGCGSDDSVSNAVLGHTLVLGVVLARLGRFDPQYRHRRLGDNHVAGWLGRHLQDRLKRGSLSFHNTTRKANFSLMGHKPPNFSFTHLEKKEGSFRLLLETKGSTFFLLIKLKPMSSYTRSRSKTLSRIVNILRNMRWSWEAEKKCQGLPFNAGQARDRFTILLKETVNHFTGAQRWDPLRKTLHSHRIDDTYKKRERERENLPILFRNMSRVSPQSRWRNDGRGRHPRNQFVISMGNERVGREMDITPLFHQKRSIPLLFILGFLPDVPLRKLLALRPFPSSLSTSALFLLTRTDLIRRPPNNTFILLRLFQL